MTNKEKADYISSKYKDWWSIEAPDVEGASYDSAMEMAEWKDKQFTEEKKQWIEKACNWLKEIFSEYENITDYNPMKDFKQAMEE